MTTPDTSTSAARRNPADRLLFAVVHCDGVYGAGTTADEAIEDSLKWLSSYPEATFDSVLEQIEDDSDALDLIKFGSEAFDSYLGSNSYFVQVGGNWYFR